MYIEYYSICDCGAITLHMDNGQSYSCKQERLNEFVPNLDLEEIEKLQDSYCCDHCVNHYGLDLCACGSEEAPSECDNEFDVCGQPMQVFGEYDCVKASDGWI